jgi:hypothetical protein
MIEKCVFLDELGPHRRVVRPVRRAGITAVTGLATVLMFISETVGTAQEVPTATQGAAVPFDPSDASGSRSDHASIERSGPGAVTNPAAATRDRQTTSASPGQWLIDDVARARAEFAIKQASPKSLSTTTTTRDAAHIESGVALHSPDGTRGEKDERGPKKVTGSIGEPPALGFGSPPSSESRAESIKTEAEGRLGAPPSHLLLKRPDEHVPEGRAGSPAWRGLDDAATKCAEAPGGQAPEGEHWYYRLDREAHRKCWYVRAHRQDESRRNVVEGGRPLRSGRIWADPLDAAWAWWYWQ